MRVEVQRGWVFALAHGGAIAHVSDHGINVITDAPGAEELLHVALRIDHRRGLAHHRVLLLLLTKVLGHHALRIDKGDQLVTTQHILVEREQRGVFDVRGMDHDQHLDVCINLVSGHRHFTHFIVHLQLLDQCPRWLLVLLLLHHRHHAAAAHGGERAHHANDGLVLFGHLLDGACDVILQLGFISRVQEGEHFLLVEALNGQAEVELVAVAVGRHALDRVRRGLVFLVGVRVGGELFHHQFATTGLAEFIEQILRGARVVAQHRRHHTVIRAGVETQGHWLVGIKALQDVLGALGQRVELVLRQVQAEEIPQATAADDEVDDHDDGDDDNRAQSADDVLAVQIDFHEMKKLKGVNQARFERMAWSVMIRPTTMTLRK